MHEEAPRHNWPEPRRRAAPAPNGEDWYANLLWFNGRKCLLLAHSATLFSIFEADLRATGLLVTRLTRRELRSEGLPPSTFADPDPERVILAKAADRSVPGCMNDMAFLCEHAISGSSGLQSTDIAALNRSLRRNVSSARGYLPPIQLTIARPVTGREAIQAIYQQMVDAGVKFAIETPLPTVRFEDPALTSTRSADNTGVRVQVPRRQPDGSWLRIIDRPEVPPP